MASVANNDQHQHLPKPDPSVNEADIAKQVVDEVFADFGAITEAPAPCPVRSTRPKPAYEGGTADQPAPCTAQRRRQPEKPDRARWVVRTLCGLSMLVGLTMLAMPALFSYSWSPFRDTEVGKAATEMMGTGGGVKTKPIEDIRVGDRLAGHNPIRAQAERVEPHPATWRKISLYMTKDNGLGMWIDLLRPEDWIAEYDIHVGNTVFIDLFEMGIEGDAEVTYVGPCPPIQPGKGTVVTGTFKHEADPGTKVVDLRLEGQEEPTGVTDNHPYWSLDRNEFVEVGSLRPGEVVDTEYGVSRVVSVTPIKYADYLYNIETTEHVYRVGSLGTLVHNSCGLARKFDGPIHHIASDKDAFFKPQFERLFNRAGLDLQSSWNRMRLEGHVGPHGKFYNGYILDRLETAVGTKTGSAARTALIEELKAIRRDIRYNGLDALLKARASWVDVMGNF